MGVTADTAEAQRKLEVLANEGDAYAQLRLGTLFAAGDFFQENDTVAREWFNKAASSNIPHIQFEVAQYLSDNIYLTADYIEANRLFQLAADQNYATAMNSLGVHYKKGIGVEANWEKAAELYRKAAELGNALAQSNLGYIYLRGQGVKKDFKKALHWFQLSAEQGERQAEGGLGQMYINGQGVEPDSKKAAYWFKRAADKGNPDAMVGLALLYRDGNGVKKDYAESLVLFQHAAEKGHIDGITHMGLAYFNGYGVDKDYAKAEGYFKKALEKNENDFTALKLLGVLYSQESQSAEKHFQAHLLFHKLAELGHQSLADTFIGWMYINGLGTSKNSKKGFQMLLKAAEAGHGTAMYFIALCYANGTAVAANHHLAREYAEKAYAKGELVANEILIKLNTLNATQNRATAATLKPDKNNPKSMLAYAVSILSKEGDNKNYTEAKTILEGLVKQGLPEAYTLLGRMNQIGDGTEVDLERAKKLYVYAADRGDAQAAVYLASLYVDKKGKLAGPCSYSKWALRAVELGEVRLLAGVFTSAKEGGCKPPEITNKLPQWIKRLEDENKMPELVQIADALMEGSVISKDPQQAMQLYLTAAENGDIYAQNQLGIRYASGNDTAADPDKAIHWLIEGAKQGSIDSYNNLCYLYATVKSRRNFEKSYQWCWLASNAGHKLAAQTISKLRTILSDEQKEQAKAEVTQWLKEHNVAPE